MPLFAKDDTKPISAFDAFPETLYFCLECKGPLKLRKQKRKIPHFYHLKTTPSCRLFGKSEDHLIAQHALIQQLPPKEATLEHPFPSAHRIADVFWEKEKIIFEIQCSFIQEQEIEQREKDYASLGLHVIWILDDRRFNRSNVRKGESAMRQSGAYFMNVHPTVVVYDQLEMFHGKNRIKKWGKSPIELSSLNRTDPSMSKKSFPLLIQKRLQNSPVFFAGDWTHKALLSENASLLSSWKKQEEAMNRPSLSLLWKHIQKGYFSLLESLLKKIL